LDFSVLLFVNDRDYNNKYKETIMIDDARAYLGQTWVGFNNPGQCVAFYNQVVQDVTGVRFIIQGADGATDILTANNVRPDICEQVINDSNDPNQLPSVGDWIIMDRTWGGGYGHIRCAEVVSEVAYTSIEQNYTPNTVTRQQGDWNHVAGWVHFFSNDPAPVPAPVPEPVVTPPAPEPVPEPTPAPEPVVEPPVVVTPPVTPPVVVPIEDIPPEVTISKPPKPTPKPEPVKKDWLTTFILWVISLFKKGK